MSPHPFSHPHPQNQRPSRYALTNRREGIVFPAKPAYFSTLILISISIPKPKHERQKRIKLGCNHQLPYAKETRAPCQGRNSFLKKNFFSAFYKEILYSGNFTTARSKKSLALPVWFFSYSTAWWYLPRPSSCLLSFPPLFLVPPLSTSFLLACSLALSR